jgi:hypothetical protein
MLKQDGKAVPVPMTFRILVERREHYRQDGFDVVADQVAEVFVVPEVERSLGDLALQSAMLQMNLRLQQLTWKCGLATDFAS